MKQSGRPVFAYPSVVAVALYYAVLGYMVPAIRTRFSLSLTEVGTFSTMQAVGAFAALLLCFCVFSALNKPRVMAVSLLLLSLSLVGLAIAPSKWVLCTLFLLTGIFVNTVDMLSNAVMADLAPDAKSRHIGLLQALFSAAGAAAPYFALLLSGDYVVVFFGLCAFALASLAVFGFGLRPQIRQPWLQYPQGFGALGKAVRLFKVRGVLPAVGLSFLGMFVQVSLCYFLSSYVQDLPNAAGASALAVCMLYTGALIGRLVYVRISRRAGPYRIMAAYNALALAGLIAMLLVRDAAVAGLMALLPGFGLSANFPGLVVETCGLVPHDTSAASALIFFGVNIAECAAPPIVGLVGDAAGLGMAFALCAGLLVPVIAVSALLARKAGRCQNARTAQV
jgi:Arabinose efflux permease